MPAQPTLPKATLVRNQGLIPGLVKGNQWLISPDHKAFFLGGVRAIECWNSSRGWSSYIGLCFCWIAVGAPSAGSDKGANIDI